MFSLSSVLVLEYYYPHNSYKYLSIGQFVKPDQSIHHPSSKAFALRNGCHGFSGRYGAGRDGLFLRGPAVTLR